MIAPWGQSLPLQPLKYLTQVPDVHWSLRLLPTPSRLPSRETRRCILTTLGELFKSEVLNCCSQEVKTLQQQQLWFTSNKDIIIIIIVWWKRFRLIKDEVGTKALEVTESLRRPSTRWWLLVLHQWEDMVWFQLVQAVQVFQLDDDHAAQDLRLLLPHQLTGCVHSSWRTAPHTLSVQPLRCTYHTVACGPIRFFSPPVASRSSISRTFCPGTTVSSWISASACRSTSRRSSE